MSTPAASSMSGAIAPPHANAMPVPPIRDRHGLPVTAADPHSTEVYAAALRAFNTYRGDPVEIIAPAIEADPEFVMGHVLAGHVYSSMWERSVVGNVSAILARLRPLECRMNERERRHVEVLQMWVRGEWDSARLLLDRLSADHPHDLLALQIGHLSDFFHGDRENLRGRIERALPEWTEDDLGYGFLLGMHAFGLEECGAYGEAEEVGRRALEHEADDCWAQHALAHVLEMQARQREGIHFMRERVTHWSQDDNAFRFHNWWHTALFHLDQGEVDRVLEVYDSGVRAEPSGVQLMLLDAAALLWRLHLQGIDVGERWEEIADHYEQAEDEAAFYSFNDMHALMAFAATGRSRALRSRLAAVTEAANAGGTNAAMARAVGIPVARGLAAFAQGEYADAVTCLLPVRYRAHQFGGSNAQRDVIHRSLMEAGFRAGDTALVTALTNERCLRKPQCPFTATLARRAVAM